MEEQKQLLKIIENIWLLDLSLFLTKFYMLLKEAAFEQPFLCHLFY